MSLAVIHKAAFAILFSSLIGCARQQLPYALESVTPRQKVVHAQRVAVVPFVDAREGDDGAEAFEYRGVDFAHTDLGDLERTPSVAITEVVARHLATSRVFSQIILVNEASDAPEADLILSARIRRARGYVESRERKKEMNLPLDERTVLAEVLISDLELREAKDARRVLLRSEFGWSILEERKSVPEPPSPWSILGEALFATGDQVVEALAAADLSGGYVVREAVKLEASTSTQALFGTLDRAAPPGWRLDRAAEDARPEGWRGTAKCTEATLADTQTHRFHRALGPYRPKVRLWACGGPLSLTYDGLVEFPAIYLGRRPDGVHYFALRLGQNNWPGAEEQIGRHLGVVAPKARHVFQIKND